MVERVPTSPLLRRGMRPNVSRSQAQSPIDLLVWRRPMTRLHMRVAIAGFMILSGIAGATSEPLRDIGHLPIWECASDDSPLGTRCELFCLASRPRTYGC